MIDENSAIALIENQLLRAGRAASPALAAARPTPRGGLRAPVCLPLAVRPSPISGPLENSNLGPWAKGSGGLAHV